MREIHIHLYPSIVSIHPAVFCIFRLRMQKGDQEKMSAALWHAVGTGNSEVLQVLLEEGGRKPGEVLLDLPLT